MLNLSPYLSPHPLLVGGDVSHAARLGITSVALPDGLTLPYGPGCQLNLSLYLSGTPAVEVARIVANPAEVDDDLLHLLQRLAQSRGHGRRDGSR